MRSHPIGLYLLWVILASFCEIQAQNGYQYNRPTGNQFPQSPNNIPQNGYQKQNEKSQQLPKNGQQAHSTSNGYQYNRPSNNNNYPTTPSSPSQTVGFPQPFKPNGGLSSPGPFSQSTMLTTRPANTYLSTQKTQSGNAAGYTASQFGGYSTANDLKPEQQTNLIAGSGYNYQSPEQEFGGYQSGSNSNLGQAPSTGDGSVSPSTIGFTSSVSNNLFADNSQSNAPYSGGPTSPGIGNSSPNGFLVGTNAAQAPITNNYQPGNAANIGPGNAFVGGSRPSGPSSFGPSNAGSLGPSSMFAGNAGSQGPSNFNAGNAGSLGPSNAFAGNAGSQGPSNFNAGSAGSIGPSSSFGGNTGSLGPNSFNAGNLGATGSSGADNDGDFSAIPGTPEKDYPILSQIPKTSFNCKSQKFPGYYADTEARCQVFHICANGIKYDFLCPNGTIFHQMYFVCVWWNQFDCSTAESFYSLNENIYDNSKMGSSGQSTNGISFGPSANFGGLTGPQGPSANFGSSTGPQGPSANFGPSTGPVGPSANFGGLTGPQGPTANFGPLTGPQGPSANFGGLVGPQGPTANFGPISGPQGPSANFGGLTGPQGPTANFGPSTGPQGPSDSFGSSAGLQGPSGGYDSTGPQGPSASYGVPSNPQESSSGFQSAIGQQMPGAKFGSTNRPSIPSSNFKSPSNPLGSSQFTSSSSPQMTSASFNSLSSSYGPPNRQQTSPNGRDNQKPSSTYGSPLQQSQPSNAFGQGLKPQKPSNAYIPPPNYPNNSNREPNYADVESDFARQEYPSSYSTTSGTGRPFEANIQSQPGLGYSTPAVAPTFDSNGSSPQRSTLQPNQYSNTESNNFSNTYGVPESSYSTYQTESPFSSNRPTFESNQPQKPNKEYLPPFKR